jgi:hypothetical protein
MAICTGTVYTQRILRTECVGNSLVTINNNFQNLDLEACRLDNEVVALQNAVGGASPSFCGIRLSLDPTTPTPTTNRTGTNANTLYLHPYKGNVFSLYDTSLNKWNSYHLSSALNASLAGLAADTNYDIFLYKSGVSSFSLELIAWTNNGTAGLPPIRAYKDNVAVKFGDPNKRFIGCLRTTNVIGQSEQSFMTYANGGGHAKQFLWNAQSIIPVTSSGFDTEQYTITTPGPNPPLAAGDTGFKRVNAATAGSNGKNNRFSFLIGDVTALDVVGQIYAYHATLAPTAFSVFGVNEEDNPYATSIGNYAQLLGESKSGTATGATRAMARVHLKHHFNPGYHYIQLFERIDVAGTAGIAVTMNRDVTIAGSSGLDINNNKTGIIASLNN